MIVLIKENSMENVLIHASILPLWNQKKNCETCTSTTFHSRKIIYFPSYTKKGIVMQVEFFHDVICSFCFLMSYRMRKVANKYPKLNITRRSFKLSWEAEEFIRMFGFHEAVKQRS